MNGSRRQQYRTSTIAATLTDEDDGSISTVECMKIKLWSVELFSIARNRRQQLQPTTFLRQEEG